MSEHIYNKQVFSLKEVVHSIQKTLAQRYTSAFWVKAEMIRLNHYPHSGHCYPDLVEKSDGKIVAQIRANLWKNDYLRINARFLSVLKEPLKDGIKILFAARIGFDPVHGLSLHILDIDPAFTLGDLEKEKQETIDQLKKENIFYKNKTHTLPLLPQRIAVISVETSKGYADFLKVIEKNEWGYRFFHFLFPALLQGENAVFSIISQLERIKKVKHHFDVVAIIRGGGGDIGLSCYNHYELAKEVALFPLPIITGIGHATNETVVEMIAFQNNITPTKMAEFLIRKFDDFYMPVHKAEERIVRITKALITNENARFQNTVKYFRSVTNGRLIQNKNFLRTQSVSLIRQTNFFYERSMQQINECKNRLNKEIFYFFKNKKTELEHAQKNVKNLDPKNILKRGFSITLMNEKPVTHFHEVKQGDHIKTILYNGQLTSEIRSIQKPEDHE